MYEGQRKVEITIIQDILIFTICVIAGNYFFIPGRVARKRKDIRWQKY